MTKRVKSFTVRSLLFSPFFCPPPPWHSDLFHPAHARHASVDIRMHQTMQHSCTLMHTDASSSRHLCRCNVQIITPSPYLIRQNNAKGQINPALGPTIGSPSLTILCTPDIHFGLHMGGPWQARVAYRVTIGAPTL